MFLCQQYILPRLLCCHSVVWKTAVSALTNASFAARLHILFCSSTLPTCLHVEGFISVENSYFCFSFSLFSLHFMAMKFEQVVCVESVSACAASYANTREVEGGVGTQSAIVSNDASVSTIVPLGNQLAGFSPWTEIIPC